METESVVHDNVNDAAFAHTQSRPQFRNITDDPVRYSHLCL
jgi:hypothetical protein